MSSSLSILHQSDVLRFVQNLRKMKTILTGIIVCISIAVQAQKNDTYDAPDQAIWHSESNTWFVSNLGGGISLEKDKNGWISRLDSSGKVIDSFWIGKTEGMHAPSGMIATKEFLYACDREGVHQINIAEKKITTFYELPEGQFINDIAMDSNGDLYVSDFFGNQIFKISPKTGKTEVWLQTPTLQTPDGLYIDNDKLIVACWGILSKPGTFETSKLGDLLSIDLKTKKIETLVKNVGNLEGITKVGPDFYITDWAAGKLLKVNPVNKTVVDFISGLSNPTDPDYAEELNVLAFPQHGTNQVLFVKTN